MRVATKIPPFLSQGAGGSLAMCARSSVDRIARRTEWKRLYLGEGKNGTVRYLRKEVEAYESMRMI